MSSLGELESQKYLVAEEEEETSEYETGMEQPSASFSLSGIRAAVAMIVIGALVICGFCSLIPAGREFMETAKTRSLGEKLTGKTWQQHKQGRSRSTIGPFDSVFYPESQQDLRKFDLPESPSLFSD